MDAAVPFGVWPDPTDGIVHLEWMGERAQRIAVLDIAGAVALILPPADAIDLGVLAQGTYQVVLIGAHGSVLAHARVVRR
jgi:hypothetical protein